MERTPWNLPPSYGLFHFMFVKNLYLDAISDATCNSRAFINRLTFFGTAFCSRNLLTCVPVLFHISIFAASVVFTLCRTGIDFARAHLLTERFVNSAHQIKSTV